MCLKNNYLLLFLVLAFVSGCGSSSSTTSSATDGSNPPPANATPKNVAAASNGATVTSSFSGNESFVIDEDTSTTNFWSGGAEGDSVTVEFDSVYSISEIVIVTNNTGYSIANAGTTLVSGIRVEVSTDGVTYDEVAIAFGYNSPPIQCFGTSFGSGRLECTLSPSVSAKYIRVGVTSDFAGTEIYEIEVTGV